MNLNQLVKVVISALEDVKANDIVVLDVAKMSTIFDRLIIASAVSTRQAKAIASNVHDKVKFSGGVVYGIEGEGSGEWVLVDLGDIVVHIMLPIARTYYNLEGLWGQLETGLIEQVVVANKTKDKSTSRSNRFK
ncbi:MAG: ribosome silencing factor [Nitrosomonadaceae bacterium]|nr:ribosome silencing factor [Nitrosomonadaceae bacterium]|tara:strand:+ start:559 stop:960 length:402 start_codon:yes stop_codon:yes gene_type:complete